MHEYLCACTLTAAELKNLVVDLQNLPVARVLPSIASRGTLRSDLLQLELSADSNDFKIERGYPYP